jgi:cytoskeleton protein RodZ
MMAAFPAFRPTQARSRDASMGSFGERLQREREMRGITLEEIADSTKIGTRSLRALEQEDFDKLPGGIFNKGFVRAYARYLGIDEEQAVTDFLAAAGDPEQPLPTPFPKVKPAASGSGGRSWAAVLALAALAGGGFAAWKFKLGPFAGRVSQVESVSPPPVVPPPTTTAAAPVSSAQAANPASSPSSEPGGGSAAAPSSTAAEGFVVLVRAKEDSWVSISADGRVVMERTLAAAETREVRAKKSVVLKMGNAAGVEVSYNNTVMLPLGRVNEAKTVVFTPEGMQP